MRRLDDYNNCKRPSNNNNKPDKRLGVGIVFIFIGALFIFSNMGLIPANLKHYIFSWQMILIVIGLFTLAGNKNKTVGLVLVSIGVFFILPGLFGLGRISLGRLWPLVFVAIGAFILVRRKSEQKETGDFDDAVIDPDNENRIDDLLVFSGSVRNISTKNFKGGKVTAIFGGADYNFNQADIDGSKAVIDVVTIFGGTKMIIPSDWNVVIDVVPIFGGFADKRNNASKIQINSGKTLIIKGLTIFGGGEIKSM